MTPIHTPGHQNLNQINNAPEGKKLSLGTKSKKLLQTGVVISAMLLAACDADTSGSKAKETTTASQEETSQNLEEGDRVVSGSAAEKAYNKINKNTSASHALNQSDFDQIESNVLDVIAFMKKKKKNTYKMKETYNHVEFHYKKEEDGRESLFVVDNDHPKNGGIISIKNHKVDGVDEIGGREGNKQDEGRISKVNALLRDFLQENGIQ